MRVPRGGVKRGVAVVTFGILGLARAGSGGDAWTCPDVERARPNPVASSAENVKHGAEIFWKMGAGLKRGEQVIMPSFEKVIPSEDRWKVVLFIRSLAQPGH